MAHLELLNSCSQRVSGLRARAARAAAFEGAVPTTCPAAGLEAEHDKQMALRALLVATGIRLDNKWCRFGCCARVPHCHKPASKRGTFWSRDSNSVWWQLRLERVGLDLQSAARLDTRAAPTVHVAGWEGERVQVVSRQLVSALMRRGLRKDLRRAGAAPLDCAAARRAAPHVRLWARVRCLLRPVRAAHVGWNACHTARVGERLWSSDAGKSGRVRLDLLTRRLVQWLPVCECASLCACRQVRYNCLCLWIAKIHNSNFFDCVQTTEIICSIIRGFKVRIVWMQVRAGSERHSVGTSSGAACASVLCSTLRRRTLILPVRARVASGGLETPRALLDCMQRVGRGRVQCDPLDPLRHRTHAVAERLSDTLPARHACGPLHSVQQPPVQHALWRSNSPPLLCACRSTHSSCW